MSATELTAVVASEAPQVPAGHRITACGALPVEPLSLQEPALVAQQVGEVVGGVQLAGLDGHPEHRLGRSRITAILLEQKGQRDGAVERAALVPRPQHPLCLLECTPAPQEPPQVTARVIVNVRPRPQQRLNTKACVVVGVLLGVEEEPAAEVPGGMQIANVDGLAQQGAGVVGATVPSPQVRERRSGLRVTGVVGTPVGEFSGFAVTGRSQRQPEVEHRAGVSPRFCSGEHFGGLGIAVHGVQRVPPAQQSVRVAEVSCAAEGFDRREVSTLVGEVTPLVVRLSRLVALHGDHPAAPARLPATESWSTQRRRVIAVRVLLGHVGGGHVLLGMHVGDQDITRRQAYGGVPVAWSMNRWLPEQLVDVVRGAALEVVAEVRFPAVGDQPQQVVLTCQRPRAVAED